MQLLIKVIWIIAILLCLFSLVWFLMGATAMFQRGMDIIGTYYLTTIWIPALIITAVSIWLLIKGWNSDSGFNYLAFFLSVAMLLMLSSLLILNTNPDNWMKEKVTSDTLKVTDDGKYEYRIELVNLFQRNGYARLYVRDTKTEDESTIPLDLPIKDIAGIAVGKINHWVVLETYEPDLYILQTTEEFKFPGEKFEIDIRSGISRRIE